MKNKKKNQTEKKIGSTENRTRGTGIRTLYVNHYTMEPFRIIQEKNVTNMKNFSFLLFFVCFLSISFLIKNF
jgi:hypothetical protein